MDWTAPTPADDDGPTYGAQRPMLEAYLSWQRRNLLRICAGLSSEQLALRPLAPSSLSLLGLLRHLAKVERIWFRERAASEAVAPLHGGAGSSLDFDGASAGEAPGAVEALEREWASATEAVAQLDLDSTVEVDGERWSLAMVYLHMIGEYARHNGHADLLRERIDGVTGR